MDLEAQEPQDTLTLVTFLGCLATNRMMKGESPGKIFLFLGLPDWIPGPLSISPKHPKSCFSALSQDLGVGEGRRLDMPLGYGGFAEIFLMLPG